jgi:hypothetical protein
VRGSDAFREQIALVAAGGKLDITFDDKALELRRRDIVSESYVQARAEAHRQRNTPGVMAQRSEAICSDTSHAAAVEPATGEAGHPRSTMHALGDQACRFSIPVRPSMLAGEANPKGMDAAGDDLFDFFGGLLP